jgi:fumarate hydratase class II
MSLTKTETRTEKDSMGELEVPVTALYGAQTQRALNHFTFSDLTMPRAFIRALGLIKNAAAHVNAELKLLDPTIATAISKAAEKVSAGALDVHFPLDVFQTGSGTSTNMNCNEVIANLIKQESKLSVHPNDHVNMGQSSNDVIPAAMNISCSIEAHEQLLPALKHLVGIIDKRANELKLVTKTGRTHLMDAMPVTFGQELSGWSAALQFNIQELEAGCKALEKLPLGGTAVGTGVNTHPKFAEKVNKRLSTLTNIDYSPMHNFFMGLSFTSAVVEFSAKLRNTAVTLTKISNDLRLMNSGPLAGFAEIILPAIQPGSSIMPGKVNPVIPEAICMISAQVMGNDLTIAIGAQAGNFQLNVMLPVIIYNALQSIQLLSNGAKGLADQAIAGFTVNSINVNELLARNPILITALNSIIGYEKGAEIAKKAYKEGRSVKDVALEMTNLSNEELTRLLDPHRLTAGGINETIS